MRLVILTAVMVTALTVAAPSRADVLCVKKTKKGVLTGAIVARSACKKKEQTIDATVGSTLGIRGDRGPGLAVVGKDGKEIGIPVSSYYGTAIVALELTPAGDSTAQWFTVGVNTGGVQKPDPSLFFDEQFVFDEPSCSTTRFLFVPSSTDANGNPVPTASAPLALSLTVDANGTTGYFARSSEGLNKQPVYRKDLFRGPTAAQAEQSCRSSGGTPVGGTSLCPSNRGPAGSFCAACCRASGQGFVAPAHTVDLSALQAAAPFTLSR